MSQSSFQRSQAAALGRRLRQPRRFLHVLAGPRQVGKSTLVQQVTKALAIPVRYASADEPTLRGRDWIAQQWEAARSLVSGRAGAILVLDEIQKISLWSAAMACRSRSFCAGRRWNGWKGKGT